MGLALPRPGQFAPDVSPGQGILCLVAEQLGNLPAAGFWPSCEVYSLDIDVYFSL
jgi:hypothetical protein